MPSHRKLIAGLFVFLFVAGLAVPLAAQQGKWDELNGRVTVLYQQGKYAEAVPVAKESLRVATETFGTDHANVATSLENLAVLNEYQGKYAEAEPLFKHALAIREKALGPDHPDVAVSLNKLGVLYFVQGMYAKAEPLYKRSLAIWEKALGPDDPDVALSLENYAALLRKTNREGEAEQLEVRAKAIRAKHAQKILQQARNQVGGGSQPMISDALSTVIKIVVWVLFAVIVGLTAQKRQRRFWPWFGVGLILSFLFAMLALGIAEFFVGLRKGKSESPKATR